MSPNPSMLQEEHTRKDDDLTRVFSMSLVNDSMKREDDDLIHVTLLLLICPEQEEIPSSFCLQRSQLMWFDVLCRHCFT